jgi:putative ABC transport system permease protein
MAVNGEYPNALVIRALTVAQGRFYNPEDQIQRARVAVIGSETKEKLFSGRNALGEHIRIDGVSFEVSGLSAPRCRQATTISIASSMFLSPQ